MKTRISVVIATYRRSELLARCLNALRNQSLPPDFFEVIVVSDGPDKATGKVVSVFDSLKGGPRFRYFALPERSGPAAARNLGWRKASASTSLVAFTDDDCMPFRRWLRAGWDGYLKAHPQNFVAFSGKIVVPCPAAPTDYQRNTARLETAEFVTANCFCSLAALEQVDGFDERFPVAWREDSDLAFSLSEHGIPVLPLDDAVVLHPVRSACWGVSMKEQRKSMYNALLYKKHPGLYRARIQRHAPWLYYTMIISSLVFLGTVTGLLPRPLMWPSAIVWAAAWGYFVIKRVLGTSYTFRHISEMICTSIGIPYLSVFWRLYGSLKYKVLFL